MGHWYRELVSKLMESQADGSFELPPQCNPEDYQITNSFRDIAKWKAKNFYEGSYYDRSLGDHVDIPKGSWQNIVYVMFSKTGNYIVPIAIADAHHHGFSMMSDRYPSLRSEFIPLAAQGNNYVYYQKDLITMIPIFTKFLAWGGNPNGVVIGGNDLAGVKITIGDLVKGKPFVKHSDPSKLAPIGQLIYDTFKDSSEAIVKAIHSGKEADFNAAKKISRKILLQIKSHSDVGIGFPYQDYDMFLKAIENAPDIQSLQETVFGFDGIKNKIHNQLREYKDKKHWNDDMISTWGNLELAIDMLGRL